jgi:hypothetical protein
MPSEH